jgi:hypothetical protein
MGSGWRLGRQRPPDRCKRRMNSYIVDCLEPQPGSFTSTLRADARPHEHASSGWGGGPVIHPGCASQETSYHAADGVKRYAHVHGAVGNTPEEDISLAREGEVGRLDMGACQLEGSSGQRVTGVTTMPTPGTATR